MIRTGERFWSPRTGSIPAAGRQAVAASSRLDAKLTGANPIDVLIEFPKGASLYAPDTLKTIAEVHAMVEKSAGVGNVW